MSPPRMRKSRLVVWLVLLAGAIAGGALTWHQSLPESSAAVPERRSSGDEQHLDDRLWWGEEFAHRWAYVSELPADVRTEGIPDLVAGEILSACSGIPPPIRDLLHRFGGRIALHRGRVTDLEECRHLRGRPLRLSYIDDGTYDEVVGLYGALPKTAYVRVEDDLLDASDTLLHELGHMLDDAMGYPSQDAAFGAALARDDAVGHLGPVESVDYPARRRSEYFAETFAVYCAGPASRRWLRRGNAGATEYWDELLREQSAARHRALTARVDALLAERVAARSGRE